MTETHNAQAEPLNMVGALVLWGLTSALAVVLIPTVLDIVLKIYAAFWGSYGFYGEVYQMGVAIRQLLTLFLGLIAVAVVIGGGEYHYGHVGEPASWKLFAETLGVEAAFLLLSAFL
ncbi:MAG: hypothetical protein ACP5HM_03730 [Anaerolineae bacterium]